MHGFIFFIKRFDWLHLDSWLQNVWHYTRLEASQLCERHIDNVRVVADFLRSKIQKGASTPVQPKSLLKIKNFELNATSVAGLLIPILVPHS